MAYLKENSTAVLEPSKTANDQETDVMTAANTNLKDAVALSQVRVLLVEDDDDDASIALDILRRCQNVSEVRRSEDGCHALERLTNESEPYHVIVLDLNMPVIDGFEFLRQMRSLPYSSDIRVVVLTTSKAFPDVRRALIASATCFITKPDSIIEFEEKLVHAVEGICRGDMIDRVV